MTIETTGQIAAKRAARLEYDRRRQAMIQADPVRRAAWLKQRAEARRRLQAAKRAEPVPPAIDLSLYRQHGPFAQLFTLWR